MKELKNCGPFVHYLATFADDSYCPCILMPYYELGSLNDYVKENGKLNLDTGNISTSSLRMHHNVV